MGQERPYLLIDSRSGLRGVLVNADTNSPIRWGRWARLPLSNGVPDPTLVGSYSAFRCEPKAAKAMGLSLRDLVYEAAARLKWVTGKILRPPTEPLPVQLPGGRQRYTRIVPLHDRGCEHYACHRAAEWLVCDETALPPLVAGGKQFEQAVTRDVRWWCSRHYQVPTVYDLDGELITIVDEIGARP